MIAWSEITAFSNRITVIQVSDVTPSIYCILLSSVPSGSSCCIIDVDVKMMICTHGRQVAGESVLRSRLVSSYPFTIRVLLHHIFSGWKTANLHGTSRFNLVYQSGVDEWYEWESIRKEKGCRSSVTWVEKEKPDSPFHPTKQHESENREAVCKRVRDTYICLWCFTILTSTCISSEFNPVNRDIIRWISSPTFSSFSSGSQMGKKIAVVYWKDQRWKGWDEYRTEKESRLKHYGREQSSCMSTWIHVVIGKSVASRDLWSVVATSGC